MLPAHATGIGQPITNRAAWDEAAARHPELRAFIPRAVETAAKPLPEQPDSLYLEYSKNGNRTHWQSVSNTRRERIQIFTLAECVENQGRFLAPLEQTIAALCAEPTWVLPAHDGHLKNFHGEAHDTDLGASMLAAELATSDYLLGDKLSPATRDLIHQNLERRLFTTYRAVMNGTHPDFGWMRASNNWYAVCLDCVTGAALATVDSPAERAWFVAVAEQKISPYFAGGFARDGYGVEGIGYWNYGFSHFALLAENIRQATRGQIDLMSAPMAAQPALFGLRSEILNGLYLSIADCRPGEEPSGILMNYVCRRFGLDPARWQNARLTGGLYEQAVLAFLPPDMPQVRSENDLADFPLRTWFPAGGVLICRPGADAAIPFAVAIKGGNNGVSHGHNDVGSFSIVSGKDMVICDPGGEIYTSRTFSAHRYDSKVLNSFGHDVPVVAGKLQQTGAAARAVVLAKDFTESADTLTLDLRSAYDVPDLQKLERTFVFHRGQSPSLEVRDQIQFASPENFELALITWGKINRISDNQLEITDGGDAVRVTIDTQGREFQLNQETINEDVSSRRKPNRVGIALAAKVSAATVTLHISPVVK